jgi:hypothetical protein
MVLRRGNRTVLVPSTPELTPAAFSTVMEAAGMTERMFEALADVAPEPGPPSSRDAGALAHG